MMMKLIGRDKEIEAIEDCMAVHMADLHPGECPAGVFMLAGPSGCGKTRTIEYLAEKWHGSHKSFVKIDCGEFQLEHEVAKLVGAPPGYLGHRETTPILTQAKLTAVQSQNCNISFVLFDEIEKAAPSMQRLLLGVMDKAQLKLGDNTSVNFEKSVIFFTSNLGTRGLFKKNLFTYVPSERREVKDLEIKAAIKSHFAPEFVNRLTEIFVYHPLTEAESLAVVRAELDRFGEMVMRRNLGATLIYDDTLVNALSKKGFSKEYGGRELKRAIHRNVVIPLAKWALREDALRRCTCSLSWAGQLVIDKVGGEVEVATVGARRSRK
jgi:ATP-dependent Clp protease ATP-binding subunit ClpA